MTPLGRLSVTEMSPKRNAVRLLFNIEDTARIPGLESALTRDLRMALTEGIDCAVFVGDDGATPNAADIDRAQHGRSGWSKSQSPKPKSSRDRTHSRSLLS